MAPGDASGCLRPPRGADATSKRVGAYRKPVRLFVAIELDERVRSALTGLQAALRPECDGVRWIPVSHVHVTVKFLGEVVDRNVNQVAEAVARAAAGASAFDMRIIGCGCFPPRGPVRIVWAGVEEGSGAMLQCFEALEAQLEPIGFPKERKAFAPHITIGRVREDRSGGRLRSAVEGQTFSPAEQSVSSINLMSSVLSPKGPTYTPVSIGSFGQAGR